MGDQTLKYIMGFDEGARAPLKQGMQHGGQRIDFVRRGFSFMEHWEYTCMFCMIMS